MYVAVLGAVHELQFHGSLTAYEIYRIHETPEPFRVIGPLEVKGTPQEMQTRGRTARGGRVFLSRASIRSEDQREPAMGPNPVQPDRRGIIHELGMPDSSSVAAVSGGRARNGAASARSDRGPVARASGETGGRRTLGEALVTRAPEYTGLLRFMDGLAAPIGNVVFRLDRIEQAIPERTVRRHPVMYARHQERGESMQFRQTDFQAH